MSGLAKAKYIVEAALFSAGRPITLEEVCDATDLGKQDVRRAIKDLVGEYRERESALTVTEAGGTFALEVRAAYAKYTMKLADQEIPRQTLKTLAIIAYHQPIQQSRLKLMIGQRVYEDAQLLRDMGLITSRPEGRSFTLRTTSRFPEYFGVDPDPAKIKEHLAKLVGVDLSKVETASEGTGEVAAEDGAEGATATSTAEPSTSPADGEAADEAADGPLANEEGPIAAEATEEAGEGDASAGDATPAATAGSGARRRARKAVGEAVHEEEVT